MILFIYRSDLFRLIVNVGLTMESKYFRTCKMLLLLFVLMRNANDAAFSKQGKLNEH